ncbi:MAG: hypothetical protein ABL985_14400 [Casimicrobium sp.]
MNPSKRYLAALAHNLDQLQRAQLAWICTRGFSAAGSPKHLFAKVCLNALFNDYISKCAKVFELGGRPASIWYIERTDPTTLVEALQGGAASLERMRNIAKRIKHLRDKDLMHIDESGVLDRERVWQEAAVEARELQFVVKEAMVALRRIVDHYRVDVPELPRQFNGPRARAIAKHLYAYLR